MLTTEKHYCPYCGELIELVLDLSMGDQEYIEDCFVCCRPIVISAGEDGAGGVHVHLRTEND